MKRVKSLEEFLRDVDSECYNESIESLCKIIHIDGYSMEKAYENKMAEGYRILRDGNDFGLEIGWVALKDEEVEHHTLRLNSYSEYRKRLEV